MPHARGIWPDTGRVRKDDQRRKQTHAHTNERTSMLDATTAESIAEQLGERKSAHLENQVANHRNQIDALTVQIAEWQGRITANLRRMAEQRDMLATAQAAAESDGYAGHLVEEWAELRKNERLVRADMCDERLTLWTTDDIRLHCEDREETRWLGAFRIVLHLESGGIELHNLNTRRGGRDHPHVVNGNPCFGGDHNTFAQLLAEGHLSVLYEMLLQYLEKLNLADEYGAYGAYWFERPDVWPEGAEGPDPETMPAVEMTVVEFAAQYGEGAEFTCVYGPNRGDQAGRRGAVANIMPGGVDVEWLDNEATESRGAGLRVTVAAEVTA